jgi:hypothetical protein
MGSIHSIKARKLVPIFALLILDISRLMAFKQIFIDRYFIIVIWSSSLIIGLGVGSLLDQLSEKRTALLSKSLITTGILTLAIIATIANAQDVQALQRYRNEASLKHIGMRLQEILQSDSTVQLEPLGYIGYYSNLHMLDEVGIVTPEVVELKKQGVSRPLEMIDVLSPDAFVIHCDDMVQLVSNPHWIQSGLSKQYHFGFRSDPLDVLSDPGSMRHSHTLARNACYEVWIK